MEEYNNAADVSIANVPESVINEMADLFYKIIVRAAAEQPEKEQMATA